MRCRVRRSRPAWAATRWGRSEAWAAAWRTSSRCRRSLVDGRRPDRQTTKEQPDYKVREGGQRRGKQSRPRPPESSRTRIGIMRHRVAGWKLGRNTSHRRALLRGLVTSLIMEDRIETTLPKAKALRPHLERMVTLGRKGDVAARRQAAGFLLTREAVDRL